MPRGVNLNLPSVQPAFHKVNEGEFQKGLANFEIGLNYLGYINPWLSILPITPADVRMMGGVVEGFGGAGKAAMHFAKAAWTNNDRVQKRETDRAWESLEYVKHGACNVGRSVVERIPLVNLIALLWDTSAKRVKYQAEKEVAVVEANRVARRQAENSGKGFFERALNLIGLELRA